MSVHLLAVFQGKVGIDCVVQAGLLIHGVVRGVDVVLGRLKVLVQIAHIRRVQQFLDQRRRFIPVFVLRGCVGIGGEVRIRVRGDQFPAQIVLCLALYASLQSRELVSIFADHALELGQGRTDLDLGLQVGVVLFDGGLAGRKLHLHRVFSVAGDIAHGLPFETGRLIDTEIGVADIVIGRFRVSVQVALKGGVEILVDLIRRIRPACRGAVFRKRGDARERGDQQNKHQHNTETSFQQVHCCPSFFSAVFRRK